MTHGLAKKCCCPFDTPTDRDKVKDEDGWTVTYCGYCRGMVKAVKRADPLASHPSVTSFELIE